MKSTRPYLIRAIYDWIVDNQQTPHLLVEVKDEHTKVPRQYIDDGVIVLNVSPSAVRELDLGNELIVFSARFNGTSYDISVPVDAVQAIYARENGQGIFLSEHGEASEQVEAPEERNDGAPVEADEAKKESTRPRRGAPHLTVVK